IELIIIDNNSEDETLSMVRDFFPISQKNPTLKIIENSENIGYARAVNQGLRIASGDYVLLINPDVFITDGFFKESVDFLTEYRDVGLVAPQHLSMEKRIIPSCREFPDHLTLLWEITGLSILFKNSKIFGRWRMGYFDYKSKREVDQPMGSCLMGRKKVVDEIGFMDERFTMFFNDVDWCRRFKENGFKVVFNPEIKVYHILGHSIKQKKFSMIFYSHFAFFLYLQKYYKKWWQRILNILSGVILFNTALVRIIILFFKPKHKRNSVYLN
ncbi:MAG: glycosyltransferase family 2 protein, partial [Candidatus Helarchaeota archaeon]|nr:glycosyltransferase family 2 protein [Candidatus Helarchaeota archaeon]